MTTSLLLLRESDSHAMVPSSAQKDHELACWTWFLAALGQDKELGDWKRRNVEINPRGSYEDLANKCYNNLLLDDDFRSLLGAHVATFGLDDVRVLLGIEGILADQTRDDSLLLLAQPSPDRIGDLPITR